MNSDFTIPFFRALSIKPGVFLAAASGVRPCNYTWNGNLQDTSYTFEFTFKPAKWINLFNYFELQGDVYMLFYTVMGLLTVAMGAFVWFLNRVLTRLRKPPPFHARVLLKLLSEGKNIV